MLVLFAAVLPVVILFCGLCIDVGMLQLRQIQLQSAADAAAIAAEMEAERGTNNWGPEAIYDADINGTTIDFVTTTIYANTQATYGEYMGRYDAMQVTLTQQQSTLFMGALVSGTITLKANAVALLTPCTYLTGNGTLQQYSLDMYSGSYNGNTCPVLINGGLRSQAYSQMSPEAIDVTGSASSTSISGFVFPGPAYGVQAFSDPLAAVTSPSFGACSPGHTSAYNLSGGTATLNPGTYCKGLNFTNATVVMNPGLYIITGGAVWSNSNVSGSGVTLFFTQGGGGSYAGLTIENTSNVTLSAPTASSNGSIAAILVFSDRNWTHTNPQDFYINNSTVLGDGIWYLKGAGLNVWTSGTFTGNNYLGIVADNIFSGGTIITPLNNYSNVQGGNPFRTTAPLAQ